jgi:glutaredoxin 3
MEETKKKNIVVYSTPTCGFCKMVKGFFQENNIEYTEKDVSQDQEAQKEMVDKSGQFGVPVTIIDDQIVVGFDKGKLSELLGIS